jgi:hypothetical protein
VCVCFSAAPAVCVQALQLLCLSGLHLLWVHLMDQQHELQHTPVHRAMLSRAFGKTCSPVISDVPTTLTVGILVHRHIRRALSACRCGRTYRAGPHPAPPPHAPPLTTNSSNSNSSSMTITSSPALVL